jgi:hypothetical protein
MRRYLAHGALALALLAAGIAQAADPAVAVLGIEPVDVPEQMCQAVTDALRQRAAATPGIRIVQGKELVEMKMIFGCDGEQASCMAQAGRSLGADKLLYGTIKKAGKTGNNVVVALKLLDVNTGVIEKFVNETVNKRDVSPGNASPIAAKWFSSLVEVEAKAMLNLTTEPPGASVTVDGQPAGRTPVTLRDLSPGPHQFVLTLAGRNSINRTIELKPGGSHEVSLQMEAESAGTPREPVTPPPQQPAPDSIVAKNPPPPASSSHPGRAATGVGIGAFAAAVVAGAVAIYTWRTYRDLEDSAHNDLAALAKTPSAAQSPDFFNHPSCNPPAGLAGAQAYKDHCSSGQTYADATTALWVTAGVLATAGVVSIIVGDRQAAKARREAPPPATKTAGRLLQQSLRIAPVFSTKSGGLSASFEF